MVRISISEIHREIQRAAGFDASSASASAAPVGILFHEVFAGLMGPQGWQAAIAPDDLDVVRTLTASTYDNLLGPLLTEKQASFKEFGRETLQLWQATRAMCAWLASLLRTAENSGLIRYDFSSRVWDGAENLRYTELALQWELSQDDWSAPVKVFGVAHALWHQPQANHWCLVEYQLGEASPEVDLAHACLYHAMITASGLGPADGAFALVTFQPELRQRLFSGAELAAAESRLRALIGRLAGVLPV